MTRHPLARAVRFFTFSIGMAGSALAGGAPPEAGIWYDDTGKGAVRVEVCGNKLCGKIYWLKDKFNAEGKLLIDKHNPNESQRTRPICGLQVFGGVTRMADGTLDSGWIYDPKEGKSYSVAMQLAGQDTLKVTGYLVMKLMGRTLTWKRAPDDLPDCAAPTEAAAGAAKLGAGGIAPAATKPAATAAPKAAVPAAAVTPSPAAKSKPVAKPATAAKEELPWAAKSTPAKARPEAAKPAAKKAGTAEAKNPAAP